MSSVLVFWVIVWTHFPPAAKSTISCHCNDSISLILRLVKHENNAAVFRIGFCKVSQPICKVLPHLDSLLEYLPFRFYPKSHWYWFWLADCDKESSKVPWMLTNSRKQSSLKCGRHAWVAWHLADTPGTYYKGQYQFLQKYICHERSCRNGGTQIPTFGHACEAACGSIPENPLWVCACQRNHTCH